MKISREEIAKALKKVGLTNGNSVIIYSDLKMFGFYRNNDGKIELALDPKKLYETIRNVIGKQGTIIVPTFSYSWTNGKVFVLNQSPSAMGIFSEFIRNLNTSVRSLHPLFSVCAIGPMAEEFVLNIDKTSYGKNSPFGKMHRYNVKQLMLGTSECPFKNYAEWTNKVFSRYSKIFKGWIVANDEKYIDEYEHCVRYDNEGVESIPFLNILSEKEKEQIRSVRLGNSHISVICSEKMYNLLLNKLRENSYPGLTEPKNGKAVKLIHLLLNENNKDENEGIQISRKVFNKNGLERWLWNIRNLNPVKKCTLYDKEGNIFLKYPEQITEIFINTYPTGGINEKIKGMELKKHIVTRKTKITENLLCLQNWIIVSNEKNTRRLVANGEYKINIIFTLNLKKILPDSKHTFCIILPGKFGVNSGADIATKTANKLLAGGMELENVGNYERVRFIADLFKQGPVIRSKAFTTDSLDDVPIMEKDIASTVN